MSRSLRIEKQACAALLMLLSPLALAVRTYCLRISSRNAFLVSMAVTAKLPNTMAMTGSVMCHR